MSTDDGIRIALFERGMEQQLVDLVVREYGTRREEELEVIERFYEHPYQREHAIRTVALDGDRVVGSQTWCRWPYLLDGRRLEAYQSGSSLVHQDYRGRRVFARLLAEVDAFREARGMDFLLVIPNPPAVGSYRRLGWHNVVNQRWHVKLLSPLSLLRRYEGISIGFDREPAPLAPSPPAQGFHRANDPEFVQWRLQYHAVRSPCFYFHHRSAAGEVRFELKPKRRGPIKELIVGDVQPGSASGAAIAEGLRALIRKARSSHRFTMLSAAFNEAYGDASVRQAFTGLGFRPIKRIVPFFVRDFTVGEPLLRPELWRLFRADSDAW